MVILEANDLDTNVPMINQIDQVDPDIPGTKSLQQPTSIT